MGSGASWYMVVGESESGGWVRECCKCCPAWGELTGWGVGQGVVVMSEGVLQVWVRESGVAAEHGVRVRAVGGAL